MFYYKQYDLQHYISTITYNLRPREILQRHRHISVFIVQYENHVDVSCNL